MPPKLHSFERRSPAFFLTVIAVLAMCVLMAGVAMQLVFQLRPDWLQRASVLLGTGNLSLLLLMLSAWLTILWWRSASQLAREHDMRLKGEAALAKSETLLRAIGVSMADGLCVKDREGQLIFINSAMQHMHQTVHEHAASAAVCRSGAHLHGDSAQARVIAVGDRDVMSSRQTMTMEETVVTATGARSFRSSTIPWIDDQGEVLGTVGISVDITERKRIEDALKAHESQLEAQLEALVGARTAEVQELMAHLDATREEEKRALARELHDGLGSVLTALNMHLAILFQTMPQDAARTERIAQIKGLLSSVATTARRIQIGLRPDKLDIFGIKIAMADQAVEFENYTGIPCRVDLPDEEVAYHPHIEIALFRMLQEVLNNIAKHAQARQVDVVLDDIGDGVVLSIRDDGVGMPAEQAGHAPGRVSHGLRGLRERAGYLGGEVRIVSAPGKGTLIRVMIPIRTDSVPEPASDRQDKGLQEKSA